MSRLYELDLERPTDYVVSRGSFAWLRVGPFNFGVNTADGVILIFAIGGPVKAVSWTIDLSRGTKSL